MKTNLISMTTLETTMFEWWAKVSPREQRLTMLTVIMVVLALGYLGFMQALDRIAAMDAAIDALEQDLIFYSEQMELLDEVDSAYQAVATEHSSEWTQEEIHDRLRQEIARLSLMNVPPPGAQVSLSDGGQHLVDIRQMPQGSLSASDAGYREYQITIRTQPTSIENVTKFLERLHKSPQALRIASLDLTRPPAGNVVTARINVIRSVVDAEKAGSRRAASDPTKNWILNSGFEDWRNEQSPADWTIERATASVDKSVATEGQRGALVKAAADGAMMYQTVQLIAGRDFNLEFSLKSTSPVHVRAYDEAASAYVGDAVTLEPQAMLKRYRVRLRVPGPEGSPVTIRTPVFVIDDEGGEIALDNVTLNELGS